MAKVLKRTTTVTEEFVDEKRLEHLDEDLDEDEEEAEEEGQEEEETKDEPVTVRRRRKVR